MPNENLAFLYASNFPRWNLGVFAQCLQLPPSLARPGNGCNLYFASNLYCSQNVGAIATGRARHKYSSRLSNTLQLQ